ncbi:hypothetical protein KI387_029740, partial [Taxus chinensis]
QSGTVGTSGCEPAKKLPGGPRSNWDIGTRGMRKGKLAESEKKNRQVLSRTVGPKVRSGRELGDSEEFVLDSPGQVGQKYAEDTGS